MGCAARNKKYPSCDVMPIDLDLEGLPDDIVADLDRIDQDFKREQLAQEQRMREKRERQELFKQQQAQSKTLHAGANAKMEQDTKALMQQALRDGEDAKQTSIETLEITNAQ